MNNNSATEIVHKLAEDGHIKLDFDLETPEQRKMLVEQILENTPPEKLTKVYLTKMADYIIDAFKEDIKEKKILTKERIKYIKREREVSLEGLSASFESKFGENNGNGSAEDYIYNLIIENDKNVILTPKNKITEQDIQEVPGLKALNDEIKRLEREVFPFAKGKQRFIVKQNIIELYKDQYVLRASYRGPINCINTIKSITKLDIYENIKIDENGELQIDANVSLLIPKHVSMLLCNYSKLKMEAYSRFTSDIYYMMLALEELVDAALQDYPLYKDLLIYKIDGLQNIEIQKKIEETYNIKYSVEYISSLWRNKIPKLIAEEAERRWLKWYYSEKEHGYWKKCSRCGQIKLAHTKFFSKNKSSKDGFYSICKDCRNKKKGV